MVSRGHFGPIPITIAPRSVLMSHRISLDASSVARSTFLTSVRRMNFPEVGSGGSYRTFWAFPFVRRESFIGDC